MDTCANDLYVDGTYIANNPSWHAEDSIWKADKISALLADEKINPASICEVGCGAGEILSSLSDRYSHATLQGYDISPQAIELCQKINKPNLSFAAGNVLEQDVHFDVIMAIDVFEHVEDCFGFLRQIKTRGTYKVFHIPLDLSALSVARLKPIMNSRETVGHIHYFMKDTALALLKETGHEIVNYRYTSGSLELNRKWKSKLLRLPRRLAYAISPDFAARMLGGFSLLVITK